MKKLLIPLALVFSLHHASAALPFFDPFADATANGGTSYTVGSALAAQQNNTTNIWNEVNQNFGGSLPLIAAGNLTYPGLTPSTGNCVSFVPATNQSVRLNFFQTNQSGPTYYSYILKITDISQVPTTNANNPFTGFSDGSTAQPAAPVARIGSRILTKATNSGFVLGIGRNNTPGDYVYDTNVHNVNEVIFIVASYELVGGVTNVNLWINPATNSFGTTNVPTPTVSAVHFSNTTGDINTNRVAGFLIMCQNSNAPSGLIDDVRVGTTWLDVTGGDPAIVTEPANLVKPAGASGTFTVGARGTATLTYGWYVNGNPLRDGGNISGSATATLTINNISSTNVGTYYVLVTNGLNNFVQSANATLALQTDPIINVQPQNVITNFGATAMFQVTPGGTSPFSYQWHEVGVGNLTDGNGILGSHSNTLVLTGVSYLNDGTYWVTVSNVNGSVDSSNATLAVNDPYFTLQPVPLTLPAGSNAVFQVAAAGSGSNSFTYQWFKNGNFIFDTGNLSGTGTPTLTISNISSTDQASYYATVNGNSTATSTVVTLTVESPVSIATQPSPRTVVPGVNVAFVVTAAGSAPFQYQWQLAGSNISGANASTLVVTNVQPAVAGNYQVIVSNSFSSATSSIAPLVLSNTVSLASNNLIVIRVGDGNETLSLNGNSMFLDQYDTSGNYINTVTVPDSGTNATIAVGMDNQGGVNSGPTTGSCLSQSLDGRYMVIAGYNTNLTYGSNLISSTAAAVPRGIALIESRGQFTLPLSSTNSMLNGNTWRSGLTDGSNNFWGGADSVGTYYFGFSSPFAVVQTNMANMRSMALFNGNIYAASAQGSNSGVLEVTGLPETATNGTYLFSGSTGTFDMAVSPNGNLIYVADQRALGSGGGLQRYDLSGTNWTLTYTLQLGGADSTKTGPRYVAGDFSGPNPVLYVTSNDGSLDNNRIVKVVDTGAGSTGTAIASAGPNQTFRGIRFGPIPDTVVAPPTLLFSRSGSNIILSWTGAFNLQSATNVKGTYTNIPSASSPYTNAMTGAQMYFRLSQ